MVILLQLPAMYSFPIVAQQSKLEAEKAENLWEVQIYWTGAYLEILAKNSAMFLQGRDFPEDN